MEPICGAVLVVVASLLAVAVVTLRCKLESAIIFNLFNTFINEFEIWVQN